MNAYREYQRLMTFLMIRFLMIRFLMIRECNRMGLTMNTGEFENQDEIKIILMQDLKRRK